MVYKINQICEDFDIAANFDIAVDGEELKNSFFVYALKLIAMKILESLPDNQARDLAISTLFEVIEFIKYSYLIGNQTK